MPLHSTPDLLDEFRSGRLVVLMDDEDRENEGDLIMPAEHVTADAINFMARYGRGLICMPMTRERCDQLGLKLMVGENSRSPSHPIHGFNRRRGRGHHRDLGRGPRQDHPLGGCAERPPFGIWCSPGHIFPLMAEPGGVLTRAGHTEAGCDLARLAGLEPAAVLVEILNEDGTMARRPELEEFARLHGLKAGTIADLIHYRMLHEKTVERVGECHMPTRYGDFRLIAFRDAVEGAVHLALVAGTIDPEQPIPIRVHVCDSLMDLTFSRRDQGTWTIPGALERIAAEGNGVIVILRNDQSESDLVDTHPRLRTRGRRRRSACDRVEGEPPYFRARGTDSPGPRSAPDARVEHAETHARHLRIRTRGRRLHRLKHATNMAKFDIAEDQYDVRGANFAVVASRFNASVVDRLLIGAEQGFGDHGVPGERLTVVRVPGAFEIPITAKRLASRGRYAAIVTLGTVIRGETPHFDYICRECAHGVMQVSMESGLPVIFRGVDHRRSGPGPWPARAGERGNKGREAALAAMEMVTLLRRINTE